MNKYIKVVFIILGILFIILIINNFLFISKYINQEKRNVVMEFELENTKSELQSLKEKVDELSMDNNSLIEPDTQIEDNKTEITESDGQESTNKIVVNYNDKIFGSEKTILKINDAYVNDQNELIVELTVDDVGTASEKSYFIIFNYLAYDKDGKIIHKGNFNLHGVNQLSKDKEYVADTYLAKDFVYNISSIEIIDYQ